MPIRFRCAYCNQLMGIARRKAGTVVRCPTCSGQVVVPDPGPAVPSAQGPVGEEHGLFERSDFDAVFQNPTQGAAPARSTVPSPAARRPGAGFDVEPVALDDQRAPLHGLFLSPGKVTLVCVIMVLLLGLAFFAGVLVGSSP